MKLDEAIKILETDHTKPVSHTVTDFNNAFKLGIEALRRLQSIRSQRPNSGMTLLPGETKD